MSDRTTTAPEPRGSGTYHYVHTAGWYRHTSRLLDQAGNIPIQSASTEFLDRRQWIAPDGSGRLLVTRGDVEIQPSGHYPAGGLPGRFLSSEDLPEIALRLRENIQRSITGGAVKAFITIWQSQVVPPFLNKILLTRLAELPDLIDEGPTTDRMGRPGTAISHTDPQRKITYRLIFDNEIGMLLSHEDIKPEAEPAGDKTPAMTSCPMWLDACYTDTTTVAKLP
ncbi:hypothetical protein [Amycolatopsis silviterrae]|uniref:Uncharacterized protein n=1 Tax=Amycolatopsis silviterrae TaxID=1656914 RepID=A0ABW5GYH2_9PSEU